MREVNDRVHVVGPEQLDWPFSSPPSFKTKGPSTHSRSHQIDPFPCYSHDRTLVAKIASRVESILPIDDLPDYFLPQYEEISRTNGYANKTDVWDDSSGKVTSWESTIVLSGKRIPPHPAMTRYLIAHEYGHLVKWQIEKTRKIDANADVTDLDSEYAAMRPGANNEYGSLKWHANVGELIANDFRILVCKVEEEFWPHPGFPRPEEVQGVRDFWEKVVAEAAKN